MVSVTHGRFPEQKRLKKDTRDYEDNYLLGYDAAFITRSVNGKGEHHARKMYTSTQY
jgi:hypothetical protein